MAPPPAAGREPDAAIAAAAAALHVAEQAAAIGDLAPLEKAVAENPDNHQARFDLALALNAEGRRDEAADALLTIFKRDRQWNDEAARKQLLLVFEAAFETEDVKLSIYKDLAGRCRPEAWFLSNTSSIPLQALSEACGLQGRMIGYHFYNPPAVQKLVEVIAPRACSPELVQLAFELARLLRKRTVPASDIAGFIGNGHFIRDGLYAIREVERLAPEHGLVPALYMVDRVSRDFLLRPMGIFQLMDYVGIDVFQLITRVMTKYLGEDLHSELLERYLALGVKGGQTSGGAQKPGFLDYQKGRPSAIFDPDAQGYAPLEGPWVQAAAARLGPTPEPALSWKALQMDPDAGTKLAAWFQAIKGMDTLGAALARRHYQASRETGLNLVRQGVAGSAEDVNEVLKLGFFHLYGPITDYL